MQIAWGYSNACVSYNFYVCMLLLLPCLPSMATYRTFLQQQQKFAAIAKNRYFDEEMFFQG
jgi:hypothetical protein